MQLLRFLRPWAICSPALKKLPFCPAALPNISGIDPAAFRRHPLYHNAKLSGIFAVFVGCPSCGREKGQSKYNISVAVLLYHEQKCLLAGAFFLDAKCRSRATHGRRQPQRIARQFLLRLLYHEATLRGIICIFFGCPSCGREKGQAKYYIRKAILGGYNTITFIKSTFIHPHFSFFRTRSKSACFRPKKAESPGTTAYTVSRSI